MKNIFEVFGSTRNETYSGPNVFEVEAKTINPARRFISRLSKCSEFYDLCQLLFNACLGQRYSD